MRVDLRYAAPVTPPVYLDHAATTPLDPAVLDAMLPYLRDEFANASSMHAAGVRARAAVDSARDQVLRAIGSRRKARLVFTGSGTEANNLAVIGAARARRGDRIVLSAVEHPSVARPAAAASRECGIPAVEVAVDARGVLDLAALDAALTEKTSFVALIHVQNETGAIQPIAAAAEVVRAKARRAHLHVDAIQSFGKLDLEGVAAVADSIALSAHKIRGPKGVGALVVFGDKPLEPIVHGGGQEGDLRSGTENVAGIAGFAAAAKLAQQGRLSTHDRALALAARVESALLAAGNARILCSDAPRSPFIVAAAVAGVRGEVLQHHLEAQGVVVGTGSACHAGAGKVSKTYGALGLDLDAAKSVIRVSLSPATSDADVAALEAALARVVPRLREFGR